MMGRRIARADCVTDRQISQLPLNGRNFTDLLFIGAGAVQTVGEQGQMRQSEGDPSASTDQGRNRTFIPSTFRRHGHRQGSTEWPRLRRIRYAGSRQRFRRTDISLHGGVGRRQQLLAHRSTHRSAVSRQHDSRSTLFEIGECDRQVAAHRRNRSKWDRCVQLVCYRQRKHAN
jgi:hypothetical protein